MEDEVFICERHITQRKNHRTRKNRGARDFDFARLKEMSATKLAQTAREFDVSSATGMRKQELIFRISASAD